MNDTKATQNFLTLPAAAETQAVQDAEVFALLGRREKNVGREAQARGI